MLDYVTNILTFWRVGEAMLFVAGVKGWEGPATRATIGAATGDCAFICDYTKLNYVSNAHGAEREIM